MVTCSCQISTTRQNDSLFELVGLSSFYGCSCAYAAVLAVNENKFWDNNADADARLGMKLIV